MKCTNCKSEFHSMNWANITPYSTIVLCDSCLKIILECRKKSLLEEINSIDKKIEMLMK